MKLNVVSLGDSWASAVSIFTLILKTFLWDSMFDKTEAIFLPGKIRHYFQLNTKPLFSIVCLIFTKCTPTSVVLQSVSLSHLLRSRSLSSWASVALRPSPRANRPRPPARRPGRSCPSSRSTSRRGTRLRCTSMRKRRRRRMCWHRTEWVAVCLIDFVMVVFFIHFPSYTVNVTYVDCRHITWVDELLSTLSHTSNIQGSLLRSKQTNQTS